MGDESSAAQPAPAPEVAAPQLEPGAPDPLLQAIVKSANAEQIELGITLLVGGFLVSGVLVSGAKYLEGLAEDFGGAFRSNPAAAENIRQSLLDLGQAFREKHGNHESTPLPMLVHLKDARFFHMSGNPIPGNRGVWWRGRLSEVSGFLLGTLSD